MVDLVSIPQAVWIACNVPEVPFFPFGISRFNTASGMDCMQLVRDIRLGLASSCFNTASGMDCMQRKGCLAQHLLYEFQYRKRYGLHATARCKCYGWKCCLFQYRKRYGLHATVFLIMKYVGADNVSIPQAVWIACNLLQILQRLTSGHLFQYRKRYGLHAT